MELDEPGAVVAEKQTVNSEVQIVDLDESLARAFVCSLQVNRVENGPERKNHSSVETAGHEFKGSDSLEGTSEIGTPIVVAGDHFAGGVVQDYLGIGQYPVDAVGRETGTDAAEQHGLGARSGDTVKLIEAEFNVSPNGLVDIRNRGEIQVYKPEGAKHPVEK